MKTMMYTLSLISLLISGFDQKENIPNSENIKRNLVQQIYTSELGVKERMGNNDGTRVEEYLRQVGLKRGNPWCAAFVCWVFQKAGVANPRTGWAAGLFPKGKVVWERGKIVAVSRLVVAGKEEAVGQLAVRQLAVRKAVAVSRKAVNSLPQKGDVFGIWFPDKNRIAHVGFVDSWNDQWLITVEGNTNEAGSREGDGVLRKRRLVRTLWQVADFIGRGGRGL